MWVFAASFSMAWFRHLVIVPAYRTYANSPDVGTTIYVQTSGLCDYAQWECPGLVWTEWLYIDKGLAQQLYLESATIPFGAVLLDNLLHFRSGAYYEVWFGGADAIGIRDVYIRSKQVYGYDEYWRHYEVPARGWWELVVPRNYVYYHLEYWVSLSIFPVPIGLGRDFDVQNVSSMRRLRFSENDVELYYRLREEYYEREIRDAYY